MIVDVNRRWIKRDHQGAGNQADGVEKIENLQAHDARRRRKNKNPVPQPAKGLILKGFGPFLFPEEKPVEEVDGRAHGAEPSAKEIPEDDHQEEDAEGRKHSDDHFSLGEQGDDADERVQPEVKVDRDLPLEGKRGLDD